MDSIEKWVLSIITLLFFVPMLGLGITQINEQTCRMELAKAGRSVDEIKQICKE